MIVGVSLLAVILAVFICMKVYNLTKDVTKFYAQGFDYGFHAREISSLWKLAKKCEIEEPLSLFVSENAVNRCISAFIQKSREEGTENTFPVQSFLETLYKFKTRVALDLDNKRGLENTKTLDQGQVLSVIYKGKGVFNSRVLNNGRELVIALPTQFNKNTKKIDFLKGEEWEHKMVSVYFWRKGDAGYAFDTEVFSSGVFRSDKALFLKHAYKLDRTQKRQSIRCACEIYGQIFIMQFSDDGLEAESSPGYKCLIEDISEDGAMIRIGGKGKSNVCIRLQFEINGSLVLMQGIVRAVEYNQNIDQSRLHFECTQIEPSMRNAILAYVYNVMPQDQKDIQEAIAQVEESRNQEQEKNHSSEEIAVPEKRPEFASDS